MKKNSIERTVIISPSGNFYGSEQVLFDFLVQTDLQYDVYVPNGLFKKKLFALNKHRIKIFTNVKILYLHIILKLLFDKYNSVYVNEGGHIRYLKLLALFFPQKKFYNHIRILEDIRIDILKSISKNIFCITISRMLYDLMPQNASLAPILLMDGYRFVRNNTSFECRKIVKVGIVGRVTPTKGICYMNELLSYLENFTEREYEFVFFGTIENDKSEVVRFIDSTKRYRNISCEFRGFVDRKDEIYEGLDLVLHLNRQEPLGRIIFEALDYNIPFLGFNDGGIGESAKKLGISSLMMDYGPDWFKKFDLVINKIELSSGEFQTAKEKAIDLLSIKKYVNNLEEIINQ